MNKDTVFSIRISSENLDEIRRRAKQARMSQSDYVVRCCLGKPVVVIEALKEFLSELRAIGNNLNRLVVLANMERITVVHLDGVESALAQLGAAVMKYTKREDKVKYEGRRLVTGINCLSDTAYEDFLRTKQIYHKEGGVLFYHMVQSFPKDADVDPKVAHAAAVELAEYFKDYEVLVCTHTDREHIHSHFIINSVNFETGRKLHMADEQLQELRQRNDMVCERFHLPVFEPRQVEKNTPERKPKPLTIGEYHVAAKGQSWKFQLMAVIDECMEYAKTPEEFVAPMQSDGYDVKWTSTRKYITYTMPDGDRCRDNKLHEEKYLKENMEYEFKIRQGILDAGLHDGRAESQEPPRPVDGERVRDARHADREELVGGDQSAHQIVFDAGYDPDNARHVADEAGRRSVAQSDRADDAGAAPAVGSDGGAVRTAGESDERAVRRKDKRSSSELGGVSAKAGGLDEEYSERYDERDALADRRADRLGKEVDDAPRDDVAPAAGRAGDHLRDRHAAEAVSEAAAYEESEALPVVTGWEKEREAFRKNLVRGQQRSPHSMTDFNADCRSASAQHERPGRYAHAVASDNAFGQVTKTLMRAERILDDDNEDPEELRRKIEAEESAQNIGALLGLATGVALGIADAKKRAEQDQAELRLSAEPQP